MKKIIITIFIVLMGIRGNTQNCIDFEGINNLDGWDLFHVNKIKSNISNDVLHGQYLHLKDTSGGSVAVNNTTLFSGDWTTRQCLCFDYMVDWNSNYEIGHITAPKIGIYRGQNIINSGSGVSYGAVFTRATFVGAVSNPDIQDHVWRNFCLPTGLASGVLLPSNAFGTWVVYNETGQLFGAPAVNAWNLLIQNVTGFTLATDYNGDPSEEVNFDNFCWGCPPSCNCGEWGSIGYYINGEINYFTCSNGITTIEANRGDAFTLSPSYLCSAPPGRVCVAPMKYDIYYPGGASLLNQSDFPDSHLDSCGIYRIVVTPFCDGDTCQPCEFYINVNCCRCQQSVNPILVWASDSAHSLNLTCGATYIDRLACFQTYTIRVNNPCGADCQPDEVITTITYPGGAKLTTNGLTGAPLIANQVGTYIVKIKVKCNGQWCNECTLTFKQTKKCELPCDNCKVNGQDKVQASFNQSGSNVTVKTHTAASTLNAAFLIGGGADTYTQVRVSVVDFNISSDNPACLQCYNTPNYWGGINGGTLNGFSPLITSHPAVSPANGNNASREIVFNAASPTTIPAATNLNLSIKIPGISPISSCCLRVALFVKVTFRNDKCEECSKIMRIDLTECPPTGNGTTPVVTFNTGTTGQPQYKMHNPNNEDAKILNQPEKENK